MFLAAAMAVGANAQTVVEDEVILGAGYANVAFYSMADGETSNIPNNDWDIAFQVSPMGSGIRINGQAGVELYRYPDGDTTAWETLDITGIDGWAQRYDSDTEWSTGAFNQGSASAFDLGWGTYSMITHHVNGDRLFVIKLVDGNYQKIWIKRLASGTYTFRHATLDNSVDMTHSIAKAAYAGKNFVYYSLSGHAVLDREPMTADWNLQFTKYIGRLTGTDTYYAVTGVLSNAGTLVAKAENVDVTTAQPENFEFDTFNISVIGYDWKSFNSQNFQFELQQNLCYFVQDPGGNIYRVIFTGFSGQALGKFEFSKELITDSEVGIADAERSFPLAVYPNPAIGGQTSIVFEQSSQTAFARVFDMGGREVMAQTLHGQGFAQRNLDVSGLGTGIYVLRLEDGNRVSTIRLAVQ
jgi:hypothetical protein